jgi:hypothetical protein
VDESGETFLAYAAFAHDQNVRTDFGDASSHADEPFHRGAVHAKTAFAVGAVPLEARALHVPLRWSGRHRAWSDAVSARLSALFVKSALDTTEECVTSSALYGGSHSKSIGENHRLVYNASGHAPGQLIEMASAEF